MVGKSEDAARPFRRIGTCAIFAWMACLLLAANLVAGVLVAPTVVVLSDKERTGRINIENPGDKAKEVEISFSFGLPVSDSLGRISIELLDSNVTDPRSAMDWIKAFPRKILLAPHGSQVVRLVAKPPENLPGGEYWAHIVVKSQEGETSFPVASEEEGITTKLNMIMKTAIALKYRTGELSARLEMTNIKIMEIDSQVVVYCDLENRGNVSYLGVLTCRLYDAGGKEISAHKSNLAVYRDLRRGIYLPLVEGEYQRPYKIDLEISGKGRTDIPQKDMVYGNEISYSAVIE
jgi:P pilus assembly chaperone PapD